MSGAVAAVGCGGEELDCTTEARSSVTVTVVDANGAPVNDAALEYSVDGGAKKECIVPGINASEYVCGFEEEGHFTITATSGILTGTATADVVADECHVIGQTVKLTLK